MESICADFVELSLKVDIEREPQTQQNNNKKNRHFVSVVFNIWLKLIWLCCRFFRHVVNYIDSSLTRLSFTHILHIFIIIFSLLENGFEFNFKRKKKVLRKQALRENGNYLLLQRNSFQLNTKNHDMEAWWRRFSLKTHY
jgi:hypothetical protein